VLRDENEATDRGCFQSLHCQHIRWGPRHILQGPLLPHRFQCLAPEV
jgi:hypothetical protein